jgi:NADH-quinone oxidoreductase subunit L
MIAFAIALPALSAAILLSLGKRTNKFGPYLAISASTGAFLVGLWQFFQLLGLPKEERTVITTVYEWLVVPAANLNINFGLQADPLSISFVLLITFVGTLIHIYSLGYMSHDENRRRFFAYLNLFVAAMLLLVLADNYLLLYVGWEGVGLASYLLIGFWQHKNSAAVAAKKAFVANRVGDFGLSLAIMTMFLVFGSVSFIDINQGISSAPSWVSLTLGLLLLLAACGKSAQFPLQSWLLDAMEGPTPVSALIHAATMVTAGVYLIVRSGEIFNASPTAQTAVVVIGAISLLMGAIIGAAKDDIKKSLAGSTMSQIGYMVLAAGLGPIGYVFAILHLITHGFFKAVMFLGAGSVMHATNDNVDMRRFGGLSKVMMFTTVTFFIGYLAILGIPPFAGFYSKDHIIEAALSHSWWAGFVVLFGAGLTAFYMTRMVVMTFFSKQRWHDDVHPHESPLSMTIPMIVLAIGSTFIGILLTQNHALEHWLEPVTGFSEPEPPFSILTITLITLSVVAVGVILGIWQYRSVAKVAPEKVSLVVNAARKDLYGDILNENLLMKPGQRLTRLLGFFDKSVVDGFYSGIGSLTGGISSRLRRSETGFVRSYAMSIILGTAIIVILLLIVRL